MTKKKFRRWQNLDPYRNPSNIFFLRYCNWRINVLNQNLIIVVIGRPGSGKSYMACAYAELLNSVGIGSKFTEDRVHFTIKDFIAQINEKDKDGKFILGKGDVIILDEAGVAVGSRDWYSEANKKVLNILETFRWRNLITILTVPDISFIDSKARKLLSMLFETQHILMKQQISIIKPLIVSVNQREGKVYYIYYQYNNPVDGQRYKITRLFIPIPSLELRNAYNKKKEAYATELALKIQRELEWSDVKKDFNSQQKKILAVTQQEGDIGYKRIAETLGMKEASVYNNLKYIYFILGKKYDEAPPTKE